jgi:hypothetical protein
MVVDEVEELLLAGPGSGDVFVWSAWPTPDLWRRGWQLEGHPPLLYRPAGGSLSPAGDLEVRRASDAAALADWERVAVEGDPLGDLAPWRPGVLFDTRVLASPLRLWVGYADERPVGAAASYVAHGLHVLALGSSFRRRAAAATGRVRCVPGSSTWKGCRRRACSAT